MTGKWTLAQCVFHLTEYLRYPMDGFPPVPLPIRMLLWSVRNTMAKKLYHQVLEKQSMPSGKPTIPQSVSGPGREDQPAADRLKETVDRWRTFGGALLPSPLFGAMTKDEFDQLHRVHMAHHLSFLVPRSSS